MGEKKTLEDDNGGRDCTVATSGSKVTVLGAATAVDEFEFEVDELLQLLPLKREAGRGSLLRRGREMVGMECRLVRGWDLVRGLDLLVRGLVLVPGLVLEMMIRLVRVPRWSNSLMYLLRIHIS